MILQAARSCRKLLKVCEFVKYAYFKWFQNGADSLRYKKKP